MSDAGLYEEALRELLKAKRRADFVGMAEVRRVLQGRAISEPAEPFKASSDDYAETVPGDNIILNYPENGNRFRQNASQAGARSRWRRKPELVNGDQYLKELKDPQARSKAIYAKTLAERERRLRELGE